MIRNLIRTPNIFMHHSYDALIFQGRIHPFLVSQLLVHLGLLLMGALLDLHRNFIISTQTAFQLGHQHQSD